MAVQIRNREESRTENQILCKAYELIAGFSKFRFEESWPNSRGTMRQLFCETTIQACITYRIFNKFRRWLNVKNGDDIMITVIDRKTISITWFECYED